MKADTDVFTTFEGDNTVLLQLVAKGLLTDYRDEFVNLDTFEVLRMGADLVLDQVLERIAPARQLVRSLIDAVPGNEGDTELRDRGYHLELFEWRERHILEGVARRMKRGIDDGSDPFEVFNAAQDHVLLAAQAHIDRVVLETFVEAIDDCEDAEVAGWLDKLCDLHALWILERERGWYMEHGRLSRGRAKAIISEVNALCAELRDAAELLIDAFGIPDEVLGAPIALGDESARQEGKDRLEGEPALPGFAPPPP
jgi:acyl-CoA oxidase